MLLVKSWETSAERNQQGASGCLWVEQIKAGQAESPACVRWVLLAQGRLLYLQER